MLQHFILFCFIGLASYFTAVQFIKYGKNEDLAALSYRSHEFDLKSPDQYPTYTICLNRPTKIIKKNSSLIHSNLKTSKMYQWFVTGGVDENENNSDVIRELEKIVFEDASIDLVSDLLSSFTRCTKEDCQSPYYEIFPLHKTHQTPFSQCYSISFSDKKEDKNFELATDKLTFNGLKLIELRANLHIYVHQGGQLIRHMSTGNSPELTSLYYWELKEVFAKEEEPTKLEITFAIGNVVILRKREDGLQKCDATLINEDEIWLKSVMEIVGCIPTYWATFVRNSIFEQKHGNCLQDQYGLLKQDGYHKVQERLFRNVSKMYTNPCTEMERQVVLERRLIKGYQSQSHLINLNFKYESNRYLEIKNMEAYDGETLLSQVGGFIGMYAEYKTI